VRQNKAAPRSTMAASTGGCPARSDSLWQTAVGSVAALMVVLVVGSKENRLPESDEGSVVDAGELLVLEVGEEELEARGSELVGDAVETLELLPADALVSWELELVVVVEEIAIDDCVSVASEAVSVMTVS
jgi:hypothetical protein